MIINPVSGKRSSWRQAWVIVLLFSVLAGAVAVAVFAAGVVSFPSRQHGTGPEGASANASQAVPAEILPVSDPRALRPLSEQEALAANARVPIADESAPPAHGLTIPLTPSQNWIRAADCMTRAIYYEAGNEGEPGQRAVAQVVINRIHDPAFPDSVCGVVFEGSNRSTGCQFSFTCDGSMARIPSTAGWERARKIAVQALSGYVFAPVGTATHYHANYVSPYWAPKLSKISVEGAHIFYRWPGRRGLSAAFKDHYVGNEPAPPLLATNELLDIAANEPLAAALPTSARQVLTYDTRTSTPANNTRLTSETGGQATSREAALPSSVPPGARRVLRLGADPAPVTGSAPPTEVVTAPAISE